MGPYFLKKHGEKKVGRFLIWLFTWTDLFWARGTLPLLVSPAVSILECEGRLAKWLARHSSFSIPFQHTGKICNSMVIVQY